MAADDRGDPPGAGRGDPPHAVRGSAEGTPSEPRRMVMGLQPVARLVPALAGRALGRKGLTLGALIGDWSSLAGPRLAERTMPIKLAFARGERTGGVLHVRVAGAVALELQHAEPQIIERVNGYFGYRAVARLKLVQAPLPAPRRTRGVDRPLGSAEEKRLAGSVAGIEDPLLKDALLRLGRAVSQRGRGG